MNYKVLCLLIISWLQQMTQKQTLLKEINDMKAQLADAKRGSESWNSKRTKTNGIAFSSKLTTQSLEAKIKALSEELRVLQNAK